MKDLIVILASMAILGTIWYYFGFWVALIIWVILYLLAKK